MRYINGERATGKTIKLIHAAYTTGYPIITFTEPFAHNLKKYAECMGCIITVYSYNRWIKEQKYLFYEHAFIDDGKELINKIIEECLHTNITAITVNIPITEKYIEDNSNADK